MIDKYCRFLAKVDQNDINCIWIHSSKEFRQFRDIIKISSVTLYFQNGAMSIYASTKNGLNSLSRVTQTELAFSNNNVNCTLCILGAVNTGIDKRTKTVDGKIGSVWWIKWDKIENGISPKKCAQLICKGECNKLDEIWISKHPELTYLYTRYKKVWILLWRLPGKEDVNKRVNCK